MTTTEAPACVDCRTTGGWVRPGKTVPNRVSGESLGIDGKLCQVCYVNHQRIALRDWLRAEQAGIRERNSEARKLASLGLTRLQRIRLHAREISQMIQGGATC